MRAQAQAPHPHTSATTARANDMPSSIRSQSRSTQNATHVLSPPKHIRGRASRLNAWEGECVEAALQRP
eukprot:6085743-Pleurochrysis_carterae.AAC.1